MRSQVEKAEVFVGVDVSKDRLDVHFIPTNKAYDFVNDSKGISALVKKLKKLPTKRVLMEATGGYEAELRYRLYKAKLPCVVANPYRVRLYARSMGILAKTDQIDAKLLAEYAHNDKLHVDYTKSAAELELSDLVVHRQQLLEIRCVINNQSRLLSGFALEQNIEILELINEKVSKVDKETARAVKANRQIREDYKILTSIPGVDKVIATTVLSLLPEIKLLDRKRIASLVGVAPFNNDSGKRKGKRITYGGRGRVRSAIFMGVLSATRYNPAIKEFYERLFSKGKPKKVAMVACIRKLLEIMRAMLISRELWKNKIGKADEAKAGQGGSKINVQTAAKSVRTVRTAVKVSETKERKRKKKKENIKTS